MSGVARGTILTVFRSRFYCASMFAIPHYSCPGTESIACEINEIQGGFGLLVFAPRYIYVSECGWILQRQGDQSVVKRRMDWTSTDGYENAFSGSNQDGSCLITGDVCRGNRFRLNPMLLK